MARICTELVYGFNTCCCNAPTAEPGVRAECTGRQDLAKFRELKAKVDMCMAGSRMAKDRAGNALANVMIPEALDYPMG